MLSYAPMTFRKLETVKNLMESLSMEEFSSDKAKDRARNLVDGRKFRTLGNKYLEIKLYRNNNHEHRNSFT